MLDASSRKALTALANEMHADVILNACDPRFIPPVISERERGWFTTEPFSEPELFTFPEGIGEIQCVNVEHEEVILILRWIDCARVTFT